MTEKELSAVTESELSSGDVQLSLHLRAHGIKVPITVLLSYLEKNNIRHIK